MPILTKLYTMEEASQHNTKDDCWVVIDGKVYDLTSYLDDHPGGDDVVIASTAKDATDDFEDAGHSESARELMQNYFIGEIENFNPAIPASKKQLGYAEKLMDLSKQPWAIAAAVVGISLVVGFLLLRKK